MENSDLDVLFRRLQAEYRNTIPQKLTELQGDIQNAQGPFDLEKVTQLRLVVHKMAGSAGTYGFMQVSEVCKKFSTDLSEMIKNKTNPNTQEMNQYFEQIKKGFSYGK